MTTDQMRHLEERLSDALGEQIERTEQRSGIESPPASVPPRRARPVLGTFAVAAPEKDLKWLVLRREANGA